MKLNAGHFHEILDRTSVFLSSIEDHLLEHRATQETPAIKADVEEILEKLAALYQKVGEIMVETDGIDRLRSCRHRAIIARHRPFEGD